MKLNLTVFSARVFSWLQEQLEFRQSPTLSNHENQNTLLRSLRHLRGLLETSHWKIDATLSFRFSCVVIFDKTVGHFNKNIKKDIQCASELNCAAQNHSMRVPLIDSYFIDIKLFLSPFEVSPRTFKPNISVNQDNFKACLKNFFLFYCISLKYFKFRHIFWQMNKLFTKFLESWKIFPYVFFHATSKNHAIK